MSIVSVDELVDYMSGKRMTTSQRNGAQLILSGVQAELERFINRSIEERKVREAVLIDESGYANLSQSPIRRVDRITYFGDQQSPSELGVIDMGDPSPFAGPSYDVVPENDGRELIVAGGLYLGSIGHYFVVEYVGGGGDFLAPHIPAMKIAILRVAAREWQQMNDDSMALADTNAQPTVDPTTVRYRGWQPEELKTFDRIRRRVMA